MSKMHWSVSAVYYRYLMFGIVDMYFNEYWINRPVRTIDRRSWPVDILERGKE